MSSGNGPVRRSSSNGRSKLPDGMVRGKLNNDLHWQNYTVDGRWICPYCLKDLRAPRSGKSGMVHHIESHLSGRCAAFHAGEGHIHSTEEINDCLLTLHIEDQARSNTAWHVFDHEGYWYSPSSMQKVTSVRVVNGRFDGFTVQQMVAHLKQCPYYAEGRIYPVENVQAARDQGIRIQSLATNLERVITQTVWRLHGGAGWLCPYCTTEVPSVQQNDLPGNILLNMAGHLMLECATYQQDPRAIKSEAILRQRLQQLSPAAANQINVPSIAPPITAPIAAPVEQPPLGRVPQAATQGTPLTSQTRHTPSDIHIPLSDEDEYDFLQAPSIQAAGHTQIPVAPPVQRTPSAEIPVAAPVRRTSSAEISVAPPVQRTPSAEIPIAAPIQQTPSAEIPIAAPLQRTPSGHIHSTSTREQSSHAQPLLAPSTNTFSNPTSLTQASQEGGLFDGSHTTGSASYAKISDEIDGLIDGFDSDIDVDILPTANTSDASWATPSADDIQQHAVAQQLPQHAQTALEAEIGSLEEANDDVFGWMEDSDDCEEKNIYRSDTAAENTDLIRAKSVQEGLMKKGPAIPGFNFGTRYEACSTVSGDFYEFVQLDNGRIVFSQGDVSGHGVEAGLIMSMARKTLSIFARQGGTPLEVVSSMNDALVDDLQGKKFITLCYAELDPEERHITWIRAGHNPVMHYNIYSKEFKEIKPGGMVVGMKGGKLFKQLLQEQKIPVQSGDIYLVYTDGFNETMNRQGEEYGFERMQHVICDHAERGVEELLDHLMNSVRQFRGTTNADDDLTLLVLAVD